MPMYAYKAVSQSGKSTRGTLSADSPRVARVKLRSSGVFLTEISETQAAGSPDSPKRFQGRGLNMEINLPVRIPAMDLAMATRQLSTLVSAGVPLVESLSALVEQTEHRALKGVLAQVRDRVNDQTVNYFGSVLKGAAV